MSGLRHQLPRLYRLTVLVAIVWLVHGRHQWNRAQRVAKLELEQIQEFYPDASELTKRTPPYNLQTVKNAAGAKIGMVLHTTPEADHVRGYSGPSDALVAMGPSGNVIGAKLLSSEDTTDHVEAVVASKEFWQSFHGLTLGAPGDPQIDAVSGSTLTSDAIVRAVVERLGGVATSSLFPTGILLAEVRLFHPDAARLEAHRDWNGVVVVYDESSSILGHALRTAPSQDALIGYQGPSDVLVLLDADAARVTGLRLRKSYDNEEYYERVEEDEAYLQLYNGWSVEEVAGVDFKAQGIEGVSGATLTSWAVAESVKRRLAAFAAGRDRAAIAKIPLTTRDLGLVLITIFALLMAFTKLRGRWYIRVGWQIILVFYLGFWTGDLLSQALLVGWAQNGVSLSASVGMLLLAATSFVIPWTTGKQVYCYQLCPHGAMQQWIRKLPVKNLKVAPRLHRILSALPAVLLALVLASVMLGVGINLASVEAFDAYLFRVAGWASITIALVGLVASAFVPLAYCKYGCPTGLLLKFIRWRGANEKFGKRDLVAGAFLLAAAGMYFA